MEVREENSGALTGMCTDGGGGSGGIPPKTIVFISPHNRFGPSLPLPPVIRLWKKLNRVKEGRRRKGEEGVD